jgi:hypothetical protein
MCRHYPMCCLVFLSRCSLHHTYWSLNTHISLTWSPILEFFSAMNLALHFLHIYRLDFYSKKNILSSNFEKILWVTSFSRYPLVEIIFYENQDGICFLWDIRLWILTTVVRGQGRQKNNSKNKNQNFEEIIFSKKSFFAWWKREFWRIFPIFGIGLIEFCYFN